jgi:hypothetical protein
MTNAWPVEMPVAPGMTLHVWHAAGVQPPYTAERNPDVVKGWVVVQWYVGHTLADPASQFGMRKASFRTKKAAENQAAVWNVEEALA